MATAHSYLDRAASVVPAGWYRVPEAVLPPQGRAVPAVLAGADLALWRDDHGDLVASDAHCPHFGAHLGHGGEVVDGCLACPFHGWRWAPDGTHAGFHDGPGTTSARLRRWPTRRVDGGDLVWWSPDGDRERWEPQALTAALPAEAVELGRLDAEGEGLHLAMMEGIVDVAHFPPLHGVEPPGIEVGFGDGPVASVELALATGAVAHLTFDGLSRVCERMDHGGYTLWMVGEYWLTAPDRAAGTVRFWGHGPHPAGVERVYRVFRRLYERQAAEDQHIWRHRRYGSAQAYGPDDRPVVAFRRWAEQFFPGEPDA